MAHPGKTYDVFIAHSVRDAGLALEVASACRESGLEAVTASELLPSANSTDGALGCAGGKRGVTYNSPACGADAVHGN